jgi:hypothetical protein
MAAVRLGVRKRRPQTEGARRRPARLQRHCPDAQCGAGRIRLGLCAGGPSAAPSRQRSSQARARGLVPSVFGVPPLLPEPPTVVASLLLARRCLALSPLGLPPCPIDREAVLHVALEHALVGAIDVGELEHLHACDAPGRHHAASRATLAEVLSTRYFTTSAPRLRLLGTSLPSSEAGSRQPANSTAPVTPPVSVRSRLTPILNLIRVR